MNKVKTLLLLIIIGWCIGYFYFLYYIKHLPDLVNKESDVIIIFGGNQERLYIGASLAYAGYAPLIFITGQKKKEQYNNFIKTSNLSPDRIIFDQEINDSSLNPIDNAVDFISTYDIESARIILNSMYYPRAKVALGNRLTDVKLILQGITRKSDTGYNILVEYIKYTLVLFLSLIGMENELYLSYS